MLLANISVAREITRAFPQFAMLRRHPPPTPGAFAGLQRNLKQHGFELDDASSLALTASLDTCVKPDDPYFNKLARILCTRCMQQARRAPRARAARARADTPRATRRAPRAASHFRATRRGAPRAAFRPSCHPPPCAPWQARYFCSGTLSPQDYHHYGLAAPIYTHFTSPIRRYSDQVVHRLLAAVIQLVENAVCPV